MHGLRLRAAGAIVVALLLTIFVSRADAGRRALHPRTLAVLRNVGAFDPDGGRIGWVAKKGACGAEIRVLQLSTHRSTIVD
jgi:hypothetical protein